MKRKIAFFDIDKTLIYGDSLHSLLRYGCKKWPVYLFLLPLIPFAALLHVTKLLSREKFKYFFYKPLEKFEEEDYEYFFDKYILSRKIEKSFSQLVSLKEQGYYIVLVTASAYAYMRIWKSRGYADEVIGTQVEEKNGFYSGKIVSKNCAGKEKVVRIKELFEKKNIEIDYENSIGFSDSDKDIPMLNLVSTRVRVLKNGQHTKFI